MHFTNQRSASIRSTASALAFFLGAPVLHAATISVTTTDDVIALDSQCSLREAVTAANTNMPFSDCPMGEALPAVDLIELPVGTYTLTLGPIGDDANLGGDLDILEAVTVRGLGNDFIWWDDPATPEVEVLDIFNDPNGFPRTFTESDLPDVVIEMGLGKLTTPGDGDRIFHIFDPAPDALIRGPGPEPEVTIENLGIVRGDAFCQADGFCRPGGAGVDHRSAANLTLRRVALLENRASCSGESCGTRTNGAAIYLESPGELRILESVVASTRALCADTDCNTGMIIYHDAFGASDITSFELDQSLVTANETFCSASTCNADELIVIGTSAQRFSQSVITGNTSRCEAAGLQCDVDELMELTNQFGLPCADSSCFRSMADVEVSNNTVRCDGFDCDTNEVLDAGEHFDLTYTRMRFQDNTQHCVGFSCDLDELADLCGSGEAGASLSLMDIEMLDNAHLCEGTECDADRTLFLDGRGIASVSNLTIRGESRCVGTRCDPSELVLFGAIASVDGLSITDSEVSCTGDDCFSRALLVAADLPNSTTNLSNVVLTGNVATCSGAGCSFGGPGNPFFIGYGGIFSLVAIGSPTAVFTLDQATISGNTTSTRGTFATNATVTIIDSSFTGNTATDGGAISNGWQESGGSFQPGDLTLERTIIDGNVASPGPLGTSTALGVGNQGGGIFNPGGATLRLRGGAITNNIAAAGGGIWNGGTIALRQGTDIVGNTPDDCFEDGGTGCEQIHFDDFESGDTSFWSATVP